MSRTCGYRVAQGRDHEGSPFKDDGPNIDTFREDDTCSYCGGVNPDTILELIRTGKVEIGPTDKDYKIYLRSIDDSNIFKIRHRTDSDSTGDKSKHVWVTEERNHAKAYFYDFSKDQKIEFLRLYNLKVTDPANISAMKIGAPGHFYVKPYFFA